MIPLLMTSLVVLPLMAGGLFVLVRRHAAVARIGMVVVTLANLGLAFELFRRNRAAGQATEISFGGWDAPIGIAFTVDGLSAIMILVSAIVAFCGALYGCGEIGKSLWRRNYASFYLLLIAGINGAFLTADLFNLFVWFEVMLMASFAMMTLGRRSHTYEGSTKYVVINMVSSFFFLSGLGILYGKVGSLNLADIGERLATSGSDPLILTSAALLLVAFGIKAGVFPLYFWLPASYPHAGFTTAAVFGGLLTKVGVYSLFRVFGSTLKATSDLTSDLFLICGAATMLVGVLGAASQYHVRKILSFHIISQIGYLVLGLGLFSQGAFAAAIFYTAHHILVKTNLFFAAGLIARAGGSEDLKKTGGLLKAQPLLAVLFLIPALSLGGIPPLSGFFAKFLLIQAAFREEAWLWAGVALGVGVLTLFSMTKIWAEAFWKAPPGEKALSRRLPAVQIVPVLALGAGTILIGIFVDPLYQISAEAAAQLIEPSSVTQAAVVVEIPIQPPAK